MDVRITCTQWVSNAFKPFIKIFETLYLVNYLVKMQKAFSFREIVFLVFLGTRAPLAFSCTPTITFPVKIFL